MFIKRKKAQAAMEFLMTYGWALLVVLIAIAALAFFGLLNPSNFLPEKCTFSSGLGCIDYRASAGTDIVLIKLQNGIGSDLIGFNISLTPSGGAACTTDTATGPGNNFLDGALTEYQFTCAGIESAVKMRADFLVNYTTSTGYMHAMSGQMVVKPEP